MYYFIMTRIFIFFILFCVAFGDKIRGVNIGGWLVLEPWITPSLFYDSFGLENKFPIDMYSFCDYHSPIVANEILNKHWDNWVSEDDIIKLKYSGINLLRVPIADWIFKPYGPYDKIQNNTKCTNGSIEKIDWIFKMSQKHNLNILLDLHGIKNSQNGFDNSGQSLNITIKSNKIYHWNTRSANWLGQFNIYTKQYDYINYESITYALDILEIIFQKYSSNKYYNLYGFNILNEPWEYTPEFVLKDFYQKSFNLFTKYFNGNKAFIIHDSFRSYMWNDFEILNNHKNHPIYIDTHQYTAWNDPYDSFFRLVDSNSHWSISKAKYPFIVGEFSLAIDNCEMWLNGFMDNLEGYPKYNCNYKTCPYANTHKDKIIKSINGPFGTGYSFPNYNTLECPTSIDFKTHFFTYNTNYNLDKNYLNLEEKDLATIIFNSKINSFERETEGWIFWNFKTESNNYMWDYLAYQNLTNSNINNIGHRLNSAVSFKTSLIIIFGYLIVMILLFLYLYHIEFKYTICAKTTSSKDYKLISPKFNIYTQQNPFTNYINKINVSKKYNYETFETFENLEECKENITL